MLKFKYILITFTFLNTLLAINMYSQHPISKYEKRWAFFHPITALKVQHHLKESMCVYSSVKKDRLLDTLENGGIIDAFRHIYTMAYLSRFVKIKYLRQLGILHEKGNKYFFSKNRQEYGERADSLSCVMDLRNNEIGFNIGMNNIGATKEELIKIVIEHIRVGNAWYFKRNEQKKYVSCKNEIIIIENYKNKWFIPKCLISTNNS